MNRIVNATWIINITKKKHIHKHKTHSLKLDSIPLYYFVFKVPPDFINSETSSDVIVRENQNLTLRCKARGHPEPK